MKQVTAHYGSAQALFGVDLELRAGEVLALMGRNGMGKTTTVRSLCRMIPVNGEMTFDGHDLSRLPSHKAARLGIGLVPEGRRCFAGLTVTENLIAAARRGYWNLSGIRTLFPRLAERRHQLAGTLSGGEQQMVAIGRALMTNPRLLVLDEATEGLAPIIRNEIWTALARLKAETGLSIIVVDKQIGEMRQLCDHAVVLERGSTTWAGPMAELTPALSAQLIGV